MIITERKLLIFIVAVLITASLHVVTYAQSNNRDKALIVNYTRTGIGRNMAVTFRYSPLEKLSLYAGPKYHINDNLYKGDFIANQHVSTNEYVYFAKVQPANFLEHFGLRLGLEQSININKVSELLFLYDFQFTKSTVSVIAGGIDSFGKTFLYTPWPNLRKGGSIYEHYLGLGLRVYTLNNIHIRLQAGIGAYKFTIGNPYNSSTMFSRKWDMVYLLGMGLEYKLGY